MKFFIKNSDPETLILIDELGTGTEPLLGGSIAESILGELNNKKVFGVLTTHYTGLKHYASVTAGIINGAMEYDNHLMQPLFRLSIGKPGSSFAFEIARKIGLPEEILTAASEKAGVKNINYDRHLKDIARDKRYWENKRQDIRKHEKHLGELIDEYEKELSEAKKVKKEIISKARDEARAILEKSNKLIENTVREIKESQAEKEKTRDVRKNVEEFKSELSKEPLPDTTAAEKKEKSLKLRAEKFIPEKNQDKIEKPSKSEGAVKTGDPVKMAGTEVYGEIVEIRDGIVQVETGSFVLRVPAERIEKISRAELKKNQKRSRSDVVFDDEITRKKLVFSSEIDIRGSRGEEALAKVQQLLDNAIIIRHRNLRILHGKGNGILRELIRNYLGSVGLVKSFRDEHIERGGSGITVVELDI